jgi:hypothetical protein
VTQNNRKNEALIPDHMRQKDKMLANGSDMVNYNKMIKQKWMNVERVIIFQTFAIA